jgi:hypothetical protein
MMLSKDDIQKQSERAYAQWAKQWREHAKAHSKYPMKSMSDFENRGVGRAILCIGNGYSFEEEIETIKQHAANVDIICCDKSLGHLLSHGIKPTFCQVADANVNYEKYLKPWETQLQDTILIGNVCANPLWAEKGNWKDRYFFCVMDILKSEREFSALANCPNTMAAGTNVRQQRPSQLHGLRQDSAHRLRLFVVAGRQVLRVRRNRQRKAQLHAPHLASGRARGACLVIDESRLLSEMARSVRELVQPAGGAMHQAHCI